MVAAPSGWVYSYTNPSVLQDQGHGCADTGWKIPNFCGQAKTESLQEILTVGVFSFQ